MTTVAEVVEFHLGDQAEREMIAASDAELEQMRLTYWQWHREATAFPEAAVMYGARAARCEQIQQQRRMR